MGYLRVFVLCMGVLLLGAGGSAFAEYRTPGTGEIYSLDVLADLSGGVLQETDFGYVLHDKLVISENDRLEIS